MNQNNKWSPAKLEIEKQRAQREYLNEKWKFHDGIIDSVGADCAKSPKAAFDSSDEVWSILLSDSFKITKESGMKQD